MVSNVAILHSPFAPRIDWRSNKNKGENLNPEIPEEDKNETDEKMEEKEEVSSSSSVSAEIQKGPVG